MGMSAEAASHYQAHLQCLACESLDHVRKGPFGPAPSDVRDYLPVQNRIAQLSGTKTRSHRGLRSIKPINAASTKSQVPIVVPS